MDIGIPKSFIYDFGALGLGNMAFGSGALRFRNLGSLGPGFRHWNWVIWLLSLGPFLGEGVI